MNIPSREAIKDELLKLIRDKRKRAFLICGAVLLLFGLAFRLVPSFEDIQGGGTEIATQMKRVEKYRQTAKGRAAHEAMLASLTKSFERAEAGLLNGKTEALAAVDIQNVLSEVALGSGLEIKSSQVLKSQKKDTDLYVSVPVQFSVNASTRQLKDILYKIEASPKFFLTVDKIGISVAGAGGSGQLRVDITVSGIMKNVKE
jgi:hypothetical protein